MPGVPGVAVGAAVSAAVKAAQKRRLEWHPERVIDTVNLSSRQKVRIATEYLKSKIVRNISKPVVKIRALGSGRIQVDPASRSRPGEFPRADTTMLMKSIFMDFKEDGNNFSGFVGTPIDYGLALELHKDRSFLRRTLLEERAAISKMLGKPIKVV